MAIQKINIKELVEEQKSSVGGESEGKSSITGDTVKTAMGIISKVPLKVWGALVGFLIVYGLVSLICDIVSLF